MEPTDSAFEAENGLRQREGTRSHDASGEIAVALSKGDVRLSEADEVDDADENSALLGRGERADDTKPATDFSHLPWHKRPHTLWILPPFFLVTLAFGGVLPPKLNLVLELICREYISEQQLADPSFIMAPVDYNGGANDQCRIPAISARVAMFTLALTLIGGITSALVAPQLGALSDRRGRKVVLVLCSIGAICNEIICIAAAMYPDTFPVGMFLIGAALDGFSGSFTVAIAIANAYASDVVTPAQRNVTFGHFHAALFTGLALGPIVAGSIVKITGQISSVFILMFVVHVIFGLTMAFVVPESLSEKRQMAARDRHEKEITEARESGNLFWYRVKQYIPYGPLKVFWPTGEGSSMALRLNLVLLASVDTIAFGVAMGTITVVLVYTNLIFGWGTFMTSVFMTVVNGARVLVLLIVLPLLVRFLKKKSQRTSGSDLFDLSIIRVAMFFDTLGFVGYTLATSSGAMLASGAVAAIGGIGSPTLQAAITRHVSPDKTGQVLGAVGLLHALARVVAPTVFSSIYAATTETFPGAVFVCLTATFSVAFMISWFIRPNVHWDDHLQDQNTEDAEEGEA